LVVLNINSELILELIDVNLKESYFSHQVFVCLILLNVAELLGQDLHFLLDDREDKDLLVFVKLTIAALAENLQELRRGLQSLNL
jgi:hypothetical protein